MCGDFKDKTTHAVTPSKRGSADLLSARRANVDRCPFGTCFCLFYVAPVVKVPKIKLCRAIPISIDLGAT